MLKLKRFLMVILSALLVFVFGVACKGGNGATLKDWSAPTYSNVSVGNTVYVQSVVAQDTDGELYTATSRVIGPAGEIAVSNSIFTASVEGTYTIVYTVKFNNMDYTKSSTFQATANGSNPGGNNPGGNNPGGNTPVTPSAVLGSLQVTAGAENYFAVSGNTVTVKNSCSFSDYKSVGYTLSGWTLANGKNVSIRVTNNTSATLGIKYKVVADGGEQYGYPDLSIAPGATQTYTGPTGTTNLENPSSVTAIELFVETTASSGTFTVEGQVYGAGGPSGSDMGTTQLSAMQLCYDDPGHTDYMSVSGNTITIKQAFSINEYKGVKFTVSNWDAAKAGQVTVSVTNNTTGAVTIKYKAITNSGTGWGYPDLTVAAGANDSYTGSALTNDQSSATSLQSIELFIGAAATGSLTITLTLF